MNCLLITALSLVIAPPEGQPPYRVAAERATVSIEDGGQILVVECPGGIGRAKIERISAAWPRHLTLRLGIKGLEGFTCRNERLEFRGALGREQVEVRTRASEKENWSAAKIKGEPKLAARRKGEIIEVELPGELLSPEAKTLHLEWIDFYRG